MSMAITGASKTRIAAAFTAHAASYDAVANVQLRVARRLAASLPAAAPGRILEIGCGTGFLSAELAALYPSAELVLTDISRAMLDLARARLGARAHTVQMDGEHPDAALGRFDLIISSLALQWFADLRGGVARLAARLSPGGQLAFATLGAGTFGEWRAAHATLGFASGLHDYPRADAFPWPDDRPGTIQVETLCDHHENGLAFLRSLKALGAGSPAPGYTPLGAAQMRRVLEVFENGYNARYEVLFGRSLLF